MNRIENAFKNKPIFMPYFPLGYPDLETSIDVIEALATPAPPALQRTQCGASVAGGARKNGADLIEVGLSFSDPLADGPVIQRATQVALEKGITVKKVLEAVGELRKRGVGIPLILMGYYNPMLAYGLEKFVRDAVDAGADGFIVPDLPMEEAEEFTSALTSYPKGSGAAGEVEAQVVPDSRPWATASLRSASAQGGEIPLIPMLAPTTSPERMEVIARNAKGFIYLVSVTGVTGERKSLAEGLGELIARVRQHTHVPVCVGFGISTPEQAREVGKMADGVIVGSACVKAIGGSETPVETARKFASEFSNALG